MLDIILGINLLWAYKTFKSVISPPVLLGLGMMLASIVATSYYDKWEMDNMLLESAIVLGGGPLFFTLSCRLFTKKVEYKAIPFFEFQAKNQKRLEILLFLSIISCIICVILKYRIYVSTFGSHLDFSYLMFMARNNIHTTEINIKIPSYINLILSFNGLISYFTCWYLSWLIIKKIRKIRLTFLLILQFVCTAISGLSDGDKGHMLEPIFRFIIIYILCFFCYKATNKLPSSLVRKLIIIAILIGISFQGLNLFLGRYVSGSNIDMLAEYCGAEIKNFDTYMHYPLKYRQDATIGGSTLYFLYHDDFKETKISSGKRYETINGFELGNVYTQYYSFHRDFGMVGVLIFSLVIASISMYFYNHATHSLFAKGKLSLCFFLYVMITLPLFMSFFSSNFTYRVFRTGFIRNIVIFYIFIWLFDKFIIKNISKQRLNNE
ncbi:MAG: oligosaccharide repeat unit polymerase [Bacteroidales bacterium]|nr:oligosaccharide repeat unit polymerase [Bacteroidales bacterium]